MNTEPLERLDLDAATLMANHPPMWRHPNKQVVFDIACPHRAPHAGTLHYSRWPATPVQWEAARTPLVIVERAGFFDYAPTLADPGGVEWHLNFADAHLFGYYSGPLFAQDEMQVAEHPALGALREALHARKMPALTEVAGRPTPVLVAGVERRCMVATDRNVAEGRPSGLYGNHFGSATAAAVRRATRRIDPPSLSNIVAIAAPSHGQGRYSRQDVVDVLQTALTGFAAARLESARLRGGEAPVSIHTGFWGCGAFGGNRVLMTALQAVAAQMAGVTQLVFHTGDASGHAPCAEGHALATELLARHTGAPVTALADDVVARGFAWGVSDGN